MVDVGECVACHGFNYTPNQDSVSFLLEDTLEGTGFGLHWYHMRSIYSENYWIKPKKWLVLHPNVSTVSDGYSPDTIVRKQTSLYKVMLTAYDVITVW